MNTELRSERCANRALFESIGRVAPAVPRHHREHFRPEPQIGWLGFWLRLAAICGIFAAFTALLAAAF